MIDSYSQEQINKEEFEKLIRCKYKSTFVSFLPSNDYMKNSHELKLCLIRDTLLNLRQVEGQYDLPINYSVEKDAKSVYAKQNEFIASMKFVEVKCLMNKFNIVNVNDKSGMEIIKPEFFYLIGENFSNCFNEMSFNCFLDDSSNFYISLSELKLLIPKFFKKNIENSKLTDTSSNKDCFSFDIIDIKSN